MEAGGGMRVHFVGWTHKYDEDFEPSQLRRRLQPAGPPLFRSLKACGVERGPPSVGERVFVLASACRGPGWLPGYVNAVEQSGPPYYKTQLEVKLLGHDVRWRLPHDSPSLLYAAPASAQHDQATDEEGEAAEEEVAVLQGQQQALQVVAEEAAAAAVVVAASVAEVDVGQLFEQVGEAALWGVPVAPCLLCHKSATDAAATAVCGPLQAFAPSDVAHGPRPDELLWFHRKCLLWSPQVTNSGHRHWFDGRFYNLDRLFAYSRAKRKGKVLTSCRLCKEVGATVGCHGGGKFHYKSIYHYACALRTGWAPLSDTQPCLHGCTGGCFFCPDHRGNAIKKETKEPTAGAPPPPTKRQRPPAADVTAGSVQLDADAELARQLQRELDGLRTVRGPRAVRAPSAAAAAAPPPKEVVVPASKELPAPAAAPAEEPSCAFCEDTVGERLKRRRGGAKPPRLAKWLAVHGYKGPPYCQRCADTFKEHQIIHSSVATAATAAAGVAGTSGTICQRAAPCDGCSTVLGHFLKGPTASITALWSAWDGDVRVQEWRRQARSQNQTPATKRKQRPPKHKEQRQPSAPPAEAAGAWAQASEGVCMAVLESELDPPPAMMDDDDDELDEGDGRLDLASSVSEDRLDPSDADGHQAWRQWAEDHGSPRPVAIAAANGHPLQPRPPAKLQAGADVEQLPLGWKGYETPAGRPYYTTWVHPGEQRAGEGGGDGGRELAQGKQVPEPGPPQSPDGSAGQGSAGQAAGRADAAGTAEVLAVGEARLRALDSRHARRLGTLQQEHRQQIFEKREELETRRATAVARFDGRQYHRRQERSLAHQAAAGHLLQAVARAKQTVAELAPLYHGNQFDRSYLDGVGSQLTATLAGFRGQLDGLLRQQAADLEEFDAGQIEERKTELERLGRLDGEIEAKLTRQHATALAAEQAAALAGRAGSAGRVGEIAAGVAEEARLAAELAELSRRLTAARAGRQTAEAAARREWTDAATSTEAQLPPPPQPQPQPLPQPAPPPSQPARPATAAAQHRDPRMVPPPAPPAVSSGIGGSSGGGRGSSGRDPRRDPWDHRQPQDPRLTQPPVAAAEPPAAEPTAADQEVALD